MGGLGREDVYKRQCEGGGAMTEEQLRKYSLTNADIDYIHPFSYTHLYANLTCADLDFSSFPLWRDSLKAQLDDRLIIQLL